LAIGTGASEYARGGGGQTVTLPSTKSRIEFGFEPSPGRACH
jgi:hypothetical protein